MLKRNIFFGTLSILSTVTSLAWGGWSIKPSQDRMSFILSFKKKEVGTLRPAPKKTKKTLAASQNVSKWVVLNFKPSTQDMQTIKGVLSQKKRSGSWEMKTRDGMPLFVRGWKGTRASADDAIIDTVGMEFESSVKSKDMAQVIAAIPDDASTISWGKIFASHKSIDDFIDLQELLRSDVTQSCHNCFNFEDIHS